MLHPVLYHRKDSGLGFMKGLYAFGGVPIAIPFITYTVLPCRNYHSNILLILMKDIRNHVFVHSDFLSLPLHRICHFLGSFFFNCPTANVLACFIGLIKFMHQVVAIHSNSAVIIGILSLPIKKWKKHILGEGVIKVA